MASWTLSKPLVQLRAEFDLLGPDRDKASDGSIGDSAHADRTSNHNPDDGPAETPQTDSDTKQEVRALDVDKSGPWPAGQSMTTYCEWIVGEHKAGRENRLVEVIYDRRRAYASDGWIWRDYTGSNTHEQHAHFGSKASQDEDGSSWGLADRFGEDLPMDQGSFNKLMDGWAGTASGKKALERAAISDVVDRLDPDTMEPVPDTDNNPQMGVNASLYYLAKDLAKVKADLGELRAALPPAAR